MGTSRSIERTPLAAAVQLTNAAVQQQEIAMSEVEAKLKTLLKKLGRVQDHRADAITAVLEAPARRTVVQRLRDTPEYVELSQAISDGRITQDAVLQALGLVDRLVGILTKV